MLPDIAEPDVLIAAPPRVAATRNLSAPSTPADTMKYCVPFVRPVGREPEPMKMIASPLLTGMSGEDTVTTPGDAAVILVTPSRNGCRMFLSATRSEGPYIKSVAVSYSVPSQSSQPLGTRLE